jgi:PhzF family phenazine biosynthesis protein
MLERWPADGWLQAVAAENNLSETAFLVPAGDPARFTLRWFTPTIEVDLCGHATLASAWVLGNPLGVGARELCFETRSGELRTRLLDDGAIELDFPAERGVAALELPQLTAALGGPVPQALFETRRRYLALYASAQEVAALAPDFRALAAFRRGVSVTAPGVAPHDFVSRFFAPGAGIDEDPVTGSAHCCLAPFWGERLGRTELSARQLSKRGGELRCSVRGERVLIAGSVTSYLEGTIAAPPAA